MKKLSEVIGVGKLVGSRGAAFRRTSTSKPDDWKDHSGKDVGAMRNFAHEKAAVAKAAASKSERESIVNKRNKLAAQRAKETLKMAKENIDEAKGRWIPDRPMKVHVAAMEKRDTADLKGMHDRWSGDHKDKKSDPSTSERLLAVHHVLKKRGENVPDLPQHRNLGMMSYVKEESSGTAARVKIKNVARLDDEPPTSEKSKLSKTGEIKTKTVDEDIAVSISRKYGLSSSLLEAARTVMEKKTQVDLDPTTDDKEDNGDDDDVKKESKHTTPKSDKEKKLATLAHPKDKITHKDVLVGRGVLKKEETEIEEAYKIKSGGYNRVHVVHNGKIVKTFSDPHSARMHVSKLNAEKSKKANEEIEIEESAHNSYKMSYEKGAWDSNHRVVNTELDLTKSPDYRKGEDLSTPQRVKVLVHSHPKHKEMRAAGFKASKYGSHGESKYGKTIKEEIDSLSEGQLEEALKKSQPAGEWVKDFVHSKDPKFAGKSKKERMKMALGAYYSKQRNEEVEQLQELSPKTLGSYAVKVASLPPEKVKPSREAGIEKATKKLRKMREEEVEFSFTNEEIERLEAIAAQLDEAKPTVVSAPIRGANQDQSGFGVKSNTADYTISDSKKVKVKEDASPMIAPPKNRYDSAAEAKAAAKKARESGKNVKIFKHTFTHPRTGEQTHSYSVKEDVEV